MMIRGVLQIGVFVLVSLALLLLFGGGERELQGQMFEVSVDPKNEVILVSALDVTKIISESEGIEFRAHPFVLSFGSHGSDRCIADGGSVDFVVEDSARIFFSYSGNSLIVSDGRGFRISCGFPPLSECSYLYFAFYADYRRQFFLRWVNDEMIKVQRIEVCRPQSN